MTCWNYSGTADQSWWDTIGVGSNNLDSTAAMATGNICESYVSFVTGSTTANRNRGVVLWYADSEL